MRFLQGRKAMTLGVAALALMGAAPEPHFDVVEASITDLDAALASGKVTSRQLVEAYLARIAAYDQAGPKLNAVITLNTAALTQADALDAERKTKGARGPLHGVPILIKDNFDTADMPTSGGTLALATLQPSADAVQVAKLRAAGAIILGKTTMHELASGVTTVSSYTGYSRNPYDLARSPGGSSGGTAAAVAASFAAAGMGSDTCGSIRVPSAYQNLVGLRGTAGLANGKGIMPLSSTQDIGGPLARSVTDLVIMLEATVEPDADGKPRSYRAMLQADGLKGARIGVIRSMFGTAPEDKEGQDVADAALARMRAAGAVLSDVALPGVEELLKDSSMTPHEFKYDLAAYLAAHPGAPVASLSEIIALGLDHDALDARFRLRDAGSARDEAAYAAVLAKRRTLNALVLRIMAEQKLDALLYPSTLRPPPLIGAEDAMVAPTCQFSATAGLPAIAIPAGFTPRGLPIGLELLGATFAEPTLISLAYGWEQTAQPRRAPFSTPPLIAGKAPAPLAFTTTMQAASGGAATVDFHYDPTTAVVDIRAKATGIAADQMIALTLQRTHDGGAGPILAPLITHGNLTGTVQLTLVAADRALLLAGGFYTVLYTRTAPLGAAKATVRVPSPK
jgi:amidase